MHDDSLVKLRFFSSLSLLHKGLREEQSERPLKPPAEGLRGGAEEGQLREGCYTLEPSTVLCYQPSYHYTNSFG